MPLYQITSAAGVDLGTYPGTDEADARNGFARDAGYADYADLIARVPGSSPTDVSADPLSIEAINPWSGALVSVDVSELTQAQLDAYRLLIDDAEADRLQPRGTAWRGPGDWLAAWAEAAGPQRAGLVILGS